MLVSSTEPQRLRELGESSSIPENFGADFLILAPKARIGVQRKQFPGDLLASLGDGRLYSQLPKLRELEQAVLIIEGLGKWTEDGELTSTDFHRFTITQMYGLIFTIMFEFGIPTLWVNDIQATESVLLWLEAWAGKAKHNSLRTRPGADRDSWGNLSALASARHIVQGLPGVGPELSDRIINHFDGLPFGWDVTFDQLLEVPGIGQKKATTMWHALETDTYD